MTRDEVAAILGSPHERFKKDDAESWYYWIDSFGVSYFGVRFGPEGRVIGTHGN
jgi:outer membrane protein assembly factor BamE (lipoprotein component of BamABCDE complex)